MIFERTIQLIGEENLNILQNSTVLVLGIGGVGGHATDALARGGIGTLILVDEDVVEPSNINRQLVALHSTIGLPKVDVMKQRILDINPDCNVITYHTFFDNSNLDTIFGHDIDFVLDCIDTITYKIVAIKESLKREIKIISSMGAGNKFHPERLEIAMLSKTTHDPIARIIRIQLRRSRVIGDIPVVFSTESQQKVDSHVLKPSSNSYVPSSFGIAMASHVINTLIGIE